MTPELNDIRPSDTTRKRTPCAALPVVDEQVTVT
jgi:hypothetical protein